MNTMLRFLQSGYKHGWGFLYLELARADFIEFLEHAVRPSWIDLLNWWASILPPSWPSVFHKICNPLDIIGLGFLLYLQVYQVIE